MMAVDLVEKDSMSVYAAAKALGINQSAVHRAIKRREDKDVCPSCNQVIRTQSV
jgi:predicted transcriptional regulator